jgi:type I restriction enzyme S subunit
MFEEKTWGEIAELKYGKALSGYRGDALADVPVYGTNGAIGFTRSPQVQRSGVIIGRKGAYRGVHYSPVPFSVIDTAFYLEPHAGIDNRWAYYALQLADINGLDSGSAIPSTTREAFYSVPVRVPRLAHQKAIAKVLAALDDKIASNTKLSDISVSLLEAKFETLGLTRDPEVDSDIVGIDELVELNPKVAAPDEAEPVYVDMQKLPVSSMNISAWERRPAKGGARFMNGDTLLARITPCLENRKTGFVDFLEDGQVGIGSTEFIVLRSRVGFPVELSYFIATSERFRTFAIRHLVGTSGRQRVSAVDLAGYSVGKPEAGALARFGDAAAPTFRLAKSLSDENRTLATTRDALIPQLISGKLRVKDAEKALENAGV